MFASRIFPQPIRSSILHLPPHLRICAYQNTTTRHFSASTPRKVELVDAAVAPPLALLDAIHSLGIPWYAAIPTAALVVRGVIVYHIWTKPAHRRAQINVNLLPLINAQSSLDMRRLEASKRFAALSRRNELLSRVSGALVSRLGRMHSIGRKFNGGVKMSPLWNFGVLMAMSEAIRMKCGSREGLLPLMMKPFEWVARKIAPAGSFADPQEVAAEKLAVRLEQIREFRLAQAQEQGAAIEPINDILFRDTEALRQQVSAASHIREDNPYFDPSLLDGGFSWCPDLTLADPTSIISLAYLITMTGTVLLNPQKRMDKSSGFLLSALKRYSIRQRLTLVFTIMVAYFTQFMPAGVVLYIASSSTIALVQRRWLNLKEPLRPAIKACARPTRMKAKKKWSSLD